LDASRLQRRARRARDARGESVDLYLVDADGSTLRNLSRTGAAEGPVWSPDGRQLAFTRSVGRPSHGASDVYVTDARIAPAAVNADRSIRVSRLVAGRQDDRVCARVAVSPASRALADGLGGGRGRTEPASSRAGRLSVMNADGRNVRRLTRTRDLNEGSPAWAPDGRQDRLRPEQGGWPSAGDGGGLDAARRP